MGFSVIITNSLGLITPPPPLSSCCSLSRLRVALFSPLTSEPLLSSSSLSPSPPSLSVPPCSFYTFRWIISPAEQPPPSPPHSSMFTVPWLPERPCLRVDVTTVTPNSSRSHEGSAGGRGTSTPPPLDIILRIIHVRVIQ